MEDMARRVEEITADANKARDEAMAAPAAQQNSGKCAWLATMKIEPRCWKIACRTRLNARQAA